MRQVFSKQRPIDYLLTLKGASIPSDGVVLLVVE